MSGHRPFRELTKRLPATRKARIEEKAAALNAALTLRDRRKSRTVSLRDLKSKSVLPDKRK